MSSVGVTAESLLSADEADVNLFSFSKLVGAGRDCCWGAAMAAIASLRLKSQEEREMAVQVSGELDEDKLEAGKLECDKLEAGKLDDNMLEENKLQVQQARAHYTRQARA